MEPETPKVRTPYLKKRKLPPNNSPALVDKVEEAYKVMKRVAATQCTKDMFTSFGEFVAGALRNLNDKRLQVWARHEINNILYQAEMAQFQSLPTNLYNNQPAPQYFHQPAPATPFVSQPVPLSTSNVPLLQTSHTLLLNQAAPATQSIHTTPSPSYTNINSDSSYSNPPTPRSTSNYSHHNQPSTLQISDLEIM